MGATQGDGKFPPGSQIFTPAMAFRLSDPGQGRRKQPRPEEVYPC